MNGLRTLAYDTVAVGALVLQYAGSAMASAHLASAVKRVDGWTVGACAECEKANAKNGKFQGRFHYDLDRFFTSSWR